MWLNRAWCSGLANSRRSRGWANVQYLVTISSNSTRVESKMITATHMCMCVCRCNSSQRCVLIHLHADSFSKHLNHCISSVTIAHFRLILHALFMLIFHVTVHNSYSHPATNPSCMSNGSRTQSSRSSSMFAVSVISTHAQHTIASAYALLLAHPHSYTLEHARVHAQHKRTYAYTSTHTHTPTDTHVARAYRR